MDNGNAIIELLNTILENAGSLSGCERSYNEIKSAFCKKEISKKTAMILKRIVDTIG